MNPTAQNDLDARRPQLDGIRALAVLMVVMCHTVSDRWYILGAHGVTLFFTLSAYLITDILVRQRGKTARHTFGIFYARRALRIFPAYYSLLAVLLVLGVPGLRGQWGWHAAYLSNWHLAATGQRLPAIAHLWTLAVEEQFYLAWPFVVLLVPARRFAPLCITLAGLAVLSRWGFAALTPDWPRVVTPTIAALDPLALGALLAVSRPRSLVWGVVVGLVLVDVTDPTFIRPSTYPAAMALGRLGMTLVSLWIIDAAAHDRLPFVFAWRPLRYVGTISYGIYLWHLPLSWALRDVWPNGWAKFAVVSGASVLIATLSWHLIERPLNNLKRRFPYGRGVEVITPDELLRSKLEVASVH